MRLCLASSPGQSRTRSFIIIFYLFYFYVARRKPFFRLHVSFHFASPASVIHFYFGADLISVISVQAFFTEIKSLPKF